MDLVYGPKLACGRFGGQAQSPGLAASEKRGFRSLLQIPTVSGTPKAYFLAAARFFFFAGSFARVLPKEPW